jgi:hypothetical protein
MVHNFDESLETGKKHESDLDTFFRRWFTIDTVPLELDKLGVDRIFTRKKGVERFSVEYKADEQAHETGNAFIEIVSQQYVTDKPDVAGWAYTSVAQRIIYYLPATTEIYILDTVALRDKLEDWTSRYTEVKADNETYAGIGLLVPISAIESVCRGKMRIER